MSYCTAHVPEPPPRFCVVRDSDAHTYLVPAERRGEAVAAIEATGKFWDPDTPESWREAHPAAADLPEWMRRIAGANVLTFTDPREDA